MNGTSSDGVHRLPENGITVVIIGAGIGGLGAALECWRKGCDVVVLERASKLSPIGDYFTITPSALMTLKEFPSMHADYHERVYDCSIHALTPAGVEIVSTWPEWRLPGVTHIAPDVDISFLKRRPVYAKMQLDQVQRLGIPVHFTQKVVNVQETETEVIVTTAEGQEFRGDVCIGSMGIGAKIDGFNAGPDADVLDSGYAVARVAFPRDMIKDGTPAATLLENIEAQPTFRVYMADDLHLILFLTADWVAWVFTHTNDGMATESWGNVGHVRDLMPYLEKASRSWDPAVLDFIRQGPEDVVDWNLRWRDYTEQWTSEGSRLLRLGDAAHAYLPTAGNGAVQALEDGVSIAECLRIAGKSNVAWATKVHNTLRQVSPLALSPPDNQHTPTPTPTPTYTFERTAILQRAGFVNREELHSSDPDGDARRTPQRAEVGFFKQGRWVWDHDPEAYARAQYEPCLAALREGRPFANTNVPPGHVFEPWSLASETARMAEGRPSGLKSNGDWGR